MTEFWAFLKENSFVVGAFTGGVAAFLLKLLVDYLQRERKCLGYTIEARTIIETSDPNLSIVFKDRVISHLKSYTVRIRNIGNRSLKDLLVRFELPGGEIVEHEIAAPTGASFPATLEGAIVKVNCDLINRSESFSIDITAIDVPDGDLKVVVRGEDLICRELSPNAAIGDILDILSEHSLITRLAVDVTKKLVRLS